MICTPKVRHFWGAYQKGTVPFLPGIYYVFLISMWARMRQYGLQNQQNSVTAR